MDQIQEQIIKETDSSVGFVKFDIDKHEERLEQVLSKVQTQQPRSFQHFSSAFYQAERVLISSDQDISHLISGNVLLENGYSTFTVRLPRPLLEIKSMQLVRASIPNAVVNIPDSETTFWYYRVPAAQIGNPFQAAFLNFVRLLPSWYQPELNINSPTYGFNRTFVDYQDLATELAKSCLADPIYDDEGPGNFFIPGDISITYNPSTNRFSMTGNNVYVPLNPTVVQYYYIAAGYLDRNLPTAQQYLQIQSATYDSFGFAPPQAYIIHKTLNLRLGFTWNGANNLPDNIISGPNNVLAYRFRPPVPLLIEGSLGVPYLNPTTYSADSYGNLVYSNICAVYSTIVAGATVDSARNTNLLAAVPMNASNLGVSFYNPIINNPLTKIVNQVYEIDITLFTDTNEPFILPNSAIVSLELAFTY